MNNYAKNEFNNKLSGFDSSPFKNLNDLSLKELKENSNFLQKENEILKDGIKKQNDKNNNNDYLISEEEEEKIIKISSPKKKNKKVKIAYEEFLKKLAKPKNMNLSKVELKTDHQKNIQNVISDIIGKENPYKPVMMKDNGSVVRNGDVYAQYLKNLKNQIKKNGNVADVLFGENKSELLKGIELKKMVKNYLEFFI